MITAEQQRSWIQQLMTPADAGLPGKSLGWLDAGTRSGQTSRG